MVSIAEGLVESLAPGGRPARWAATGRSGGVSDPPYDSLNLADYVGDDPEAVAGNRALLAAAVGVQPDALAVMGAVHGCDLAVVDGPGSVPGVDALLTQAPELALVALGADCIPLALIGDDGRTVAAVHCGWRGLVADVVAVAVSAVRDHGADVRLAVLGPSACGQCYAVPVERAREVVERTSARVSGAALARTLDGQPGIDLRRGVTARLLELGIALERIEFAGACTIEDAGLFSYRRDDITGRQGIAVCTMSCTP